MSRGEIPPLFALIFNFATASPRKALQGHASEYPPSDLWRSSSRTPDHSASVFCFRCGLSHKGRFVRSRGKRVWRSRGLGNCLACWHDTRDCRLTVTHAVRRSFRTTPQRKDVGHVGRALLIRAERLILMTRTSRTGAVILISHPRALVHQPQSTLASCFIQTTWQHMHVEPPGPWGWGYKGRLLSRIKPCHPMEAFILLLLLISCRPGMDEMQSV